MKHLASLRMGNEARSFVYNKLPFQQDAEHPAQRFGSTPAGTDLWLFSFDERVFDVVDSKYKTWFEKVFLSEGSIGAGPGLAVIDISGVGSERGGIQ